MNRVPYLMGYDISDDRLRRELFELLSLFSSSRQKSVFETFLTDTEKRDLLMEVKALLDERGDIASDSFFLTRLYRPDRVIRLGVAPELPDPSLVYIG